MCPCHLRLCFFPLLNLFKKKQIYQAYTLFSGEGDLHEFKIYYRQPDVLVSARLRCEKKALMI